MGPHGIMTVGARAARVVLGVSMSMIVSMLAGLVLAGSAQAQSPTAQAAPTQEAPSAQTDAELGDIDVTGYRSVREQAEAFVEEVAEAPRGRGLARWDREVCVGAAYMSPRYAQFMIDRVAAHALELGLEVGGPDCRPNIMIVASADPDRLARELVEDDPYAYRPSMGPTDLGRRALSEFQTTDAPVRWWHVSLPVMKDSGEIAVRLRGEDARFVNVHDASRLRSNVREDLARVLIVIDANRIPEVQFGALSDYVAMVALAQIDPDVDPAGWDTVLNLFNPDKGVEGLTDWDRDYLKALYEAPRDRAWSRAQTDAIASDLARSVADDQEPAERNPAEIE